MAVYKQVKRVSDLNLLSKVISDAQVLLAVNKKNWQTTLSNIDQQKIVKVEYDSTDEDGKINAISLSMKDGSIIRFGVRNGTTGDKGKTGKTGERGDKGDAAFIDPDRSENYVMIVNDCETDDASKVLSASQGVLMNKSIHELRETYMSDEKYQLLFNNLIFMDAEFVSTQDDEQVLLFNADPADHKLYIKYWTYESDGSVEYFVYNDFAKTYDSLNADLWDDIYLGATTGYFIATNAQLSDGNELYVLNRSTNEYDKITIDESGNRTFKYYLSEADCIVNVYYDKIKKLYDYALDAEELELNIYQQVSAGEYKRIMTKEELDMSGFTMYYERVDGEYVYISNLEAYLEKKPERYYIKNDSSWVEVESLDVIDTNNFKEYIKIEYNKTTNNNVFTHYVPVKTIFETYYDTHVSVLTNYSISFYIYDELREYFTRRLVDKGNGVWDYEYTKINIPFWVDCEYITDEEDQTILLLYSDKEQSEIETITPIYINSIEFENDNIEIPINSVKDISVNIHPSNVNVTDMTLEYDDNLISIYEDGRIAAVQSELITTETMIKLSSKHNPNIYDTCNVTIVTPIKEIILSDDSIELYPGSTKQMEYTTIPEQVSNNKVVWETSDNKMISIDENGLVSLVQDEEGNYKTGTCKLTCTASDGYGASKQIDVLVAIPVEEIIFGKYKKNEETGENEIILNDSPTNICFVDIKNTLDTIVKPDNATEPTIKYSSSDETIIKIDQYTGEYEPLQKGEAYLYASSTDGTDITISKKMIVNSGVTKMEVTGIDEKLDIGLTNEYEVVLTPAIVDNNEIEIIISDPSLVDYTQPELVEGTTNIYKGSITAKAPGNVNIGFIAKDGSGTGVSADMYITIPISDISFGHNRLSMFVGDILSLTPIIGPDNATNIGEELIWKSSNPAAATVDNYGRVKGISASITVISATTKDSNAVMASCVITVNVKSESVILNDGAETKDILLNNVAFINAKVTPDNASNQILMWMSSDESIVSVQENGVITGNSLGTAVITATTTDGTNISSSITINVVNTFNKDEMPEQNTDAINQKL